MVALWWLLRWRVRTCVLKLTRSIGDDDDKSMDDELKNKKREEMAENLGIRILRRRRVGRDGNVKEVEVAVAYGRF